MSEAVGIGTNIFHNDLNFEETSLHVFNFQYANNPVYKRYVDLLKIDPANITAIDKIPFLPIRFFKTHRVASAIFNETIVFESSGTTETINSRHYIKDKLLYEKSFLTCFEQFYGNISDWCVLGLLPSYLERNNSSLVYMVKQLIEKSRRPYSGFYLYEFEKLSNVLKDLEQQNQQTLLIGVTFALLDFARQYPLPLKYTTIMETGGMKGRRKEMIREDVHERLKGAFKVDTIHSEYGMTELLSQAYSKGNGLFRTPHWVRILIRDVEDPLSVKPVDNKAVTKGLINIIDLANIYSCSFIATDDLGSLHSDGTFEVTGRMDNSDLRGCSLLTL